MPNSGPTALVNSRKSVLIAPQPVTPDYYAFTVAACETDTLGLTDLSPQGNVPEGNVSLELVDGSGAIIATGVGGFTNFAQAIVNYSLTAAGTYYACVIGNGANTPYSLVLTRNATLDAEPNDTPATSQSLDGTQGALGFVAQATSTVVSLDAFDQGAGDLANYTFLGTNNASIISGAAHDGQFGLSVGDSTDWMYRNDVSTHVQQGDIVSVWVQSSADTLSGLPGRAYFGFGATANGTYSMVMAENTGELQLQLNVNYGLQVLGTVPQTWLKDHWYRFEVTWQTDGTIVGRLYDSDGTTLLNTVRANDTTFTSGGIAFRGFGSVKSFDSVITGTSWPADEDWYSISVNLSSTDVNLATYTPTYTPLYAPDNSPGEFVNDLTPVIELYDPSGTLVASGAVGPDGRNQTLQYAAQSVGVYYVHVLGTNNSQGEYYLSSQVIPPDTTPPTATLSAATVTAAGATTYTFTVEYADNVAVRVASLNGSDLLVTGPNNFSQTAAFVSVDTGGDGTPRTATYTITPPGGSWSIADNGQYTVSVQANQVRDTSGNFVSAGSLGTFAVNISTQPDTTPPTATLSASTVTVAGATTYTFTVRYADNVAVNVASLDGLNLLVTGPNGFSQAAAYVSVDTGGNGTPRTATYTITPPGGNWDTTDDGTYSVAMQAKQVSDTSGNYVPAGSLGTFTVNISSQPDTTPPTATLSAPGVTAAGATTYTFTVTYADNVAVSVASLAGSGPLVTGPNGFGFSQTATYVSVDTSSDGTPRTATYTITPPGGAWDIADNGTYTVAMQANQVSDTSGNFVPAGPLGTFTVNVSVQPQVTIDEVAVGEAYPPFNGILESDEQLTITWAVNGADAVATRSLSVDSNPVASIFGPYAGSNGTYYMAGVFGPVSAGSHAYSIQSADSAGHSATSAGTFSVVAAQNVDISHVVVAEANANNGTLDSTDALVITWQIDGATGIVSKSLVVDGNAVSAVYGPFGGEAQAKRGPASSGRWPPAPTAIPSSQPTTTATRSVPTARSW